MNDLISMEQLVTELEIEIDETYNDDIIKGIRRAIEIVEQRPTVEPVRGEWIVKEDENCFATWDYCSICGFSTGFAGSSHYINFCPNCGADMRGENDEK